MTPASLQGSDEEPNAVHAVPVGDDITHDTAGTRCPCGAQVTEIRGTDGSTGTFVVHLAVFAGLLAPQS
ncbi:hypothetical protein AB0G49_14305 [Streptomyces longwoodensis]|uniref:hypothetical protein n=1 Tax=Streptomyces longwoodensis TaxID=68231 RepID=UPI0033F45DDF